MKHKIGLGFAVFTLFAWVLFSVFPDVTDTGYGQTIFPMLRRLLDILFGWIPFSLYWFWWVGVIGGLLLFLFKFVRSLVRRKQVAKNTKRLLFFSGGVVAGFMWLWGFNYKRPSLPEKASLELTGCSDTMVFNSLSKVVDSLNYLALLSRDGNYDPEDIQSNVRAVLRPWGYHTLGDVRIRQIRPTGMMMRFSAAGMYMPFAGEGNIDHGLHPLQKPFVTAHEMSHGFGVTDEGACNFVALLACLKSSNTYVRYAGWLGYYRYLASAAAYLDRDRYLMIRELLNDEVVNTLRSIRENSLKYPDIMPAIRDQIYDSYLKSQGVKKGILSYNEVVMLKMAYDLQYGG